MELKHAVKTELKNKGDTRQELSLGATHQVTKHPLHTLLEESKADVSLTAHPAHGYHSLVPLLDPHHRGVSRGLVVERD